MGDISMQNTMQKLLSKTRQAINEYNLIEEGDKIAVGLSGGKDSLTLLHILKNYQKFSPQKFDLIAITSNFLGYRNWADCVIGENKQEFLRIVNLYSHSIGVPTIFRNLFLVKK